MKGKIGTRALSVLLALLLVSVVVVPVVIQHFMIWCSNTTEIL